MKIKQITKQSCSPIRLIDIGVEDNHTFYVSNKANGNFVLTHNSFPDIDTDFGDRDTASKLIAKHFGEENVIPVSNFNQLQLRSLIKDVCRLQGVPFDEINQYTKKIESEAMNEAKKEPGFDAQQWELTYEEAEEKSPTFRELMVKYPDLEKTVKILFKQMRNISRHAGGVIITDNAIDNMPVVKSGGVLQTPWQEGLNFRHLEGFGFLKFDILGLGTLRIFENCIRRILKKRGQKYISFDDVKQFFYNELHPDNNPMTDMKVYNEVYWNSHYTGVFQFVQKNVQSFMSKMKPNSIVDIATATSIFRPGPLSISADKLYLKNRSNPENIVYKHPLLKDVLESTAGLIIFQEQLQLIYHKLAGVPLEDTDDIRKSLLKKDKSNKEKADKERLKIRQDFIDRCLEANNIDNETSADIFDEMMKFVSYSFNKSHAVAYAITSYQCAHLLTYYPDEWVASYIDYCVNDKGKASGKEAPKDVALAEARALGYRLGKPDINLSSMEFDCDDKKVLIPSFSALKSVGSAAFYETKQYRPYKTLEDLLWNSDDTWRHSKFNKRAMSTLIKLEAFDSMNLVGEGCQFDNYRQLHHVLVDNADALKRSISKKTKTHKKLLAEVITEAKLLPDWELEEKVKASKELSGAVDINLIITPEIGDYLKSMEIKSIDDWSNEKDLYWAIVQSAKMAKTKTGKSYARVALYGDSGETQNCFFWSFNEKKDTLLPENILIIGSFKKSDFGLSSFYGKIEILEKKK